MSALLEFSKFTHLNNWSVAHLLESKFEYNKNYSLAKIDSFLIRNKTKISINDNTEYKRVKIKLYNKGVFLRDKEIGKNIGTKKQFLIKKGQFLLSKIDARNGAFGLATDEVDGAIITADFFAYDIDITKIEPYFLVLMTTTKKFQQFAQSASSGTTGRQRINEQKFLDVKIPLPPLKVQKKIVQDYQNKFNLSVLQEQQVEDKEKEIEEYLYQELGIEILQNNINNDILAFVNYKNMFSWGVEKNINNKPIFTSNRYSLVSLKNVCTLVRGVTYKKSSELNKGGYKVLRANNITLENMINFDDIKFISKNEDFSKNKLLVKDDIFICLASGSKKHIGKVAYIEDDLDYYFGGFMGSIRVNNKSINPRYLYSFLNSKLFNKYLSIKIFGANINNINSELIYNFEIPIPSIDTQNIIANYIKFLKKQIKNLKEQSIKNRNLALIEFEKEIFNET